MMYLYKSSSYCSSYFTCSAHTSEFISDSSLQEGGAYLTKCMYTTVKQENARESWQHQQNTEFRNKTQFILPWSPRDWHLLESPEQSFISTFILFLFYRAIFCWKSVWSGGYRSKAVIKRVNSDQGKEENTVELSKSAVLWGQYITAALVNSEGHKHPFPQGG